MRGRILAVAGGIMLVATTAGCRGDEADDPAAAADAVNEMLASIESGDATTACAGLTSGGEAAIVKVMARETGERLEDCKSAMDAYAEQTELSDLEDRFDASDVTLSEERGEVLAQVNCPERGGYILAAEDGEWQIETPFCVD